MTKLNTKKLREKFAILANEKRLKMIILCSQNENTVSELSKEIGLTYSITSRYISDLEKAGFVSKQRNPDSSVMVKSLIRINEKGEVSFD